MNAAILHLAFSLASPTLPALPSDTPPTLPVPIAALAHIKSAEDVVSATVLADGRRAPAELVLPKLDNYRHTLEYMRVHYPEDLRAVSKREPTIAWLHVTDQGKVSDVRLLTTSGYAELDTLSLAVLRMALFKPATHNGKAVSVWLPFPAAIPPYRDLIERLEAESRPLAEAPQEVAYTQKPNLLNRNQVEAAIIRIIHQLDPQIRQFNEALTRAQGAAGIAQVHVFIDEGGAVQNGIISKSSGNRELDDAAIDIVRMMRFSPARNGDKPVAVWIEVPIRFVRSGR